MNRLDNSFTWTVIGFVFGFVAGLILLSIIMEPKRTVSVEKLEAAIVERDKAVMERDFWRATLRRLVEGEGMMVQGRASKKD